MRYDFACFEGAAPSPPLPPVLPSPPSLPPSGPLSVCSLRCDELVTTSTCPHHNEVELSPNASTSDPHRLVCDVEVWWDTVIGGLKVIYCEQWIAPSMYGSTSGPYFGSFSTVATDPIVRVDVEILPNGEHLSLRFTTATGVKSDLLGGSIPDSSTIDRISTGVGQGLVDIAADMVDLGFAFFMYDSRFDFACLEGAARPCATRSIEQRASSCTSHSLPSSQERWLWRPCNAFCADSRGSTARLKAFSSSYMSS
eukprot:4793672-Pleurochrysis_carterae.AAC.1